MAKIKKITPGVPNVDFPKDSKGIVKAFWRAKDEYTWDDMLQMMTEAMTKGGNYKGGTFHGASSPSEYYTNRLIGQMGENPDINDWKRDDGKGGPLYSTVRFVMERCWRASKEFRKVNEEFLAEYNSRQDMQDFYREMIQHQYYFYDVWGNNHYKSPYNEASDEVKAVIASEEIAPSSYTSYYNCMCSWQGKQTLEKMRPAVFEEGDLVVLRDPYVGHCDHDPLWLSRYQQHQQGVEIPSKETLRIGTVMKLTDDMPWRASKGSKQIDVLWFGKEDSNRVPEKILKFHERPTYANGLKKRES